MLKINYKWQSTDITHSLQCVLEFQSDHAQWRIRGEGREWGHATRSVNLGGGVSTHLINCP